MLLTGTYERSLDGKLRLAIPKRMRDAVSTAENCVMFLTPGTDGSLALYPEESFALLGQQLNSASPNGRDVRAFSRMFYALAERCEVDSQGRVRIPPELAKLASIDKDVVLLGVRDHIEIWDKQAWLAYLDGAQADYDQIAEKAFDANPLNSTVVNKSELSGTESVGKPR